MTNFSFNGVTDSLIDCFSTVSLARIVDGWSSSANVECELMNVDGRSFSLFESMLAISQVSDTDFRKTIVFVPFVIQRVSDGLTSSVNVAS